MNAQTVTLFDGATITLIQPFKAAETFDGCEMDEATDIEASAEAYWEQYAAAVAEAYPLATVRVDTPWQQYSKPFGIDVDTADGGWSDQHEEERNSIHAIGEMVFERGSFWVEDASSCCDQCGTQCGAENLTKQSDGAAICGACEFSREQA